MLTPAYPPDIFELIDWIVRTCVLNVFWTNEEGNTTYQKKYATTNPKNNDKKEAMTLLSL
jgi:hypothetical protein